MQVIGIDPGLINTGWAVIEEDGSKIKYLGSGICKTGNKEEKNTSFDKLLSNPFTKVLAVEPPVTTLRGNHVFKPFFDRT